MIVHFCIPDKFIQPYIDFVENNFENHIFLVLENNSQYKIRLSHNIILIKNKWQLFYVLAYFNFAKKIIKAGANYFKIPLHSFDAQLHDKITQKENSFEETIKGIKNLIKLT